MRERLFIILSLVLLVAALIGLNAASYVQVGREPDTESAPNRSTYNPGATGTAAFYGFLRETGRSVVRWQEKPAGLLDNRKLKPKTFVVIGNLRRRFEDNEIKDLLTWVAAGGKLVLIDRRPIAELLASSGGWELQIASMPLSSIEGDPSNANEMTNGVVAARPAQPTLLTAEVNSVMPSRFASSINLKRTLTENAQAPKSSGAREETNDFEDEIWPPAPAKIDDSKSNNNPTQIVDPNDEAVGINDAGVFPFLAPVTHLTNNDKNILADYRYGSGQITVLSDPYIVSNGGINLVDNLQLAVNVVGGNSGDLIAFDEYHHGYGAGGNSLISYVEGTPFPALAAQLALVVLFFMWTQGKRFARAVPMANPDRRSKLEYVGAMAELQRNMRAFDLAIENVYARVRRKLSRFVGADNLTTPRHVLAERVAARSKLDRAELDQLMRECEDAIHGERVNDKKALSLVGRLRQIEQKLGLSNKSSSEN